MCSRNRVTAMMGTQLPGQFVRQGPILLGASPPIAGTSFSPKLGA